MRVIAGQYKGRVIPFNNKSMNNAESTSQILKEALFSIVGSSIESAIFLDLFACSGQISLEALSRGAGNVIINEKDRRRYFFIRDMLTEINIPQKDYELYNLDFRRMLEIIDKNNVKPNVIFLDPPYVKSKGLPEGIYKLIIEELENLKLVNSGVELYLQHFTGNVFPSKIGELDQVDSRKYGSSTLTIYR